MKTNITDYMKVDSKRVYDDRSGNLIAHCRMAKMGIQEYRAFELGIADVDPNTIINVFRPEEEVFDEDSLSTFKGAIVTDDHPSEFVDTQNKDIVTKGYVISDAVREGSFVTGEILVTDQTMINKIRDGKTQLSVGYTSSLEAEEGVWNDTKYSIVQRDIRVNHLSVVDLGRAGPMCAVADSLPEPIEEAVMPEQTEDLVILDDQEVDAIVEEETITVVEDAVVEVELTDAEIKLADAMAELANLQGKLENAIEAKLNTEVALAEFKDKAILPEDIENRVQELLTVCDHARKIVPNMDFKGKSASEIKYAVVTDRYAQLDIPKDNESYVAGLFDSLAMSAKTVHAIDGVFTTKPKTKSSQVNIEEEARQRMIQRNRGNAQ